MVSSTFSVWMDLSNPGVGEWAAACICRQMAMSAMKFVTLTLQDEKSASIRMAVGVRTETDRFSAYFYERPCLL